MAAPATPAIQTAGRPAGADIAQATRTASAAAKTTPTAARQTPKWRIRTSQDRLSRMVGAGGRRHTRLNTSVPFVPPNPKLFFMAYSIFISRAVLAQ